MKREFEFDQRVERSILTTYRKELWKPFILAVKRYELIQEGDRIAVCISGGKDSMLLAKNRKQRSLWKLSVRAWKEPFRTLEWPFLEKWMNPMQTGYRNGSKKISRIFRRNIRL